MRLQNRESLTYAHVDFKIYETPLEEYFIEIGKRPLLNSNHDLVLKGYMANWEVKENNKLFLTNLEFYTEEQVSYGVEYFFPGQVEVFAYWYSNTIEGYSNRKIETYNNGMALLSGTEILLTFKDGVIVKNPEIHNGLRIRDWIIGSG